MRSFIYSDVFIIVLKRLSPSRIEIISNVEQEFGHTGMDWTFGFIRSWFCRRSRGLCIIGHQYVFHTAGCFFNKTNYLFKVVFGSSKMIDKSREYNFLHPWLATGLLTSTGNVCTVRGVIRLSIVVYYLR